MAYNAEIARMNGSALGQIHAGREKERREEVDRLIPETYFAKEVQTAIGPAILLCGEVINIQSSNPALHVEVITRALRQAGQEPCSGEATLQASLSPSDLTSSSSSATPLR